MPPRVPLSTLPLRQTNAQPYVCASCLLKSLHGQPVNGTQPRQRRKDSATETRKDAPRLPRSSRGVSTRENARYTRRAYSNGLASTSAINAPSTVPPAYRELYQRLLALQDAASSYVDLSRLQAATRSLESDEPVIRVALLGLGSNGSQAARKLARVLLGDALGEEEAWERQILESSDDGRSLLLRYGDAEEAVQSDPLVETLNVPSIYLRRHNLEILISTLNIDGGPLTTPDSAALEQAVLVPTLTTPNSSNGRVGFVRYPVHKAVIVAEGITGALEYGRFPTTLTDGNLVSAALSLPLRPSSGTKSAEHEATGNAVDLDLAEHALSLFRTSKANGAQFSEEWQRSRMPALSEWIAGSQQAQSGSGFNSAVHNLISSVITTTATSITAAEAAETALVTSATVPDTKRSDLQSAVSTWSADAHRDLQTNLDSAFTTSSSWRRTAWWRLFWRIDDVTISASEVLRGSWLIEAEQALAFLSGRIFDSGLASREQLRGPAPQLLDGEQKAVMAEYDADKGNSLTVAELMQVPSMLSRMQLQSGVNPLFTPPWPQTISLSRQYMLHTLVLHLHRKAQALLVTTLSTIGGSAALSVWFYFATAGLALYESGAIASLGLVWALRRLQKKWGEERNEFARTVREDARRVLGEVEGQLRGIVNEGGRVSVRAEDAWSWFEAREAVDGCRKALQRVADSR